MVYDDEAERHKAEARAKRDAHLEDEHRKGAHCGKQTCYCTHSGGCYKGWIDSPDGPTKPCPMCRPAVFDRLKAKV